MGTHIELDTSRDDSSILSSSSPSRESDTRDPEDATSVQFLKGIDTINLVMLL